MTMFTIYGSPTCPWCDKAEDFLTQRGEVFTKIDITKDPEAKAFILGEGHQTVPQVYIADTEKLQNIGGYEALVGYFTDPMH